MASYSFSSSSSSPSSSSTSSSMASSSSSTSVPLGSRTNTGVASLMVPPKGKAEMRAVVTHPAPLVRRSPRLNGGTQASTAPQGAGKAHGQASLKLDKENSEPLPRGVKRKRGTSKGTQGDAGKTSAPSNISQESTPVPPALRRRTARKKNPRDGLVVLKTHRKVDPFARERPLPVKPPTFPNTLICLIGDCLERFAGNGERHRHMVTKHFQVNAKCPGCGQEFSRDDAVKRHLEHKDSTACLEKSKEVGWTPTKYSELRPWASVPGVYYLRQPKDKKDPEIQKVRRYLQDARLKVQDY